MVIYSSGESGLTSGGLDAYLGPQAQDHSNLPEYTEDAASSGSGATIDCDGKARDQAVCKIAKAEQEARAQQGST